MRSTVPATTAVPATAAVPAATAMPAATALPAPALPAVLGEGRSTTKGEPKRRNHCQQNTFHDHLLDDTILDLTHKTKFG
jgi:hypothetical protein